MVPTLPERPVRSSLLIGLALLVLTLTAGLLTWQGIQIRGPIVMTMLEFSFRPAQPRVVRGEDRRVVIVLQNTGLIRHNLVIPDLGVASADVAPGQSDRVEFAAPQPGTFRFICTMPGHEEKGMVGYLTIE
jgi:plastocyanin